MVGELYPVVSVIKRIIVHNEHWFLPIYDLLCLGLLPLTEYSSTHLVRKFIKKIYFKYLSLEIDGF